jgi:hypothetical protein
MQAFQKFVETLLPPRNRNCYPFCRNDRSRRSDVPQILVFLLSVALLCHFIIIVQFSRYTRAPPRSAD